MKYIVNYYFDGNGCAYIDADSKEEAKEKFFNGEYDIKVEDEWGENYQVDIIEEVKQ
jgi:hypothetical protein